MQAARNDLPELMHCVLLQNEKECKRTVTDITQDKSTALTSFLGIFN